MLRNNLRRGSQVLVAKSVLKRVIYEENPFNFETMEEKDEVYKKIVGKIFKIKDNGYTCELHPIGCEEWITIRVYKKDLIPVKSIQVQLRKKVMGDLNELES